MSGFGRRHPRSGAVAMEFAIVASVLMLIFFAILGLCLLMWSQSAVQAAAAQTARCAAIGAPGCTSPNTPGQYAANVAAIYAFPGLIKSSDVSVQSTATTCAPGKTGVAAGSFTVVTISSVFWAASFLPPPLNQAALRASACYPNAG